jgi:hypothetical protein
MRGYWHEVFDAAWRKVRPFAWRKENIAGAAILVVTTMVAGGLGALSSLAVATVAAIGGVFAASAFLFAWGLVKTQAELYSALSDATDATIATLRAEVERLKEPLPDFDKWCHVDRLELKTAAQLWSNVRPRLGLAGRSRESYEMLRAAIQKGELEFDTSRLPADADRTLWQNPPYDTIVTRKALQAFAALHRLDPEFLRERPPHRTAPAASSPS